MGSTLITFPNTTKDPLYYKIQDALYDWRDRALPLWDPSLSRSFFGASVFMPASIIERLCHLAVHRAAPTVQILTEQLDWSYRDRYAAELFTLIASMVPPPPISSPSPDAVVAPPQTGNVLKQPADGHRPRQITCSNCKRTGHNSTFYNCAVFAPTAAAADVD